MTFNSLPNSQPIQCHNRAVRDLQIIKGGGKGAKSAIGDLNRQRDPINSIEAWPYWEVKTEGKTRLEVLANYWDGKPRIGRKDKLTRKR